MDFAFQGKYVISGKIECITGLHIGGSTEGFEIAGMDNPVIRDPLTDQPYIPGSSLKGKLRSLLEWSLGENQFTGLPHHFTPGRKPRTGEPTYQPCSCGRCEACHIFGVTPQTGVRPGEAGEDGWWMTGPARLTVRDAFPTEETVNEWKTWLGQGIYTEIKSENAIDRVTSEANPRTMERVPAGSKFEFEMIFDVYKHSDLELLKRLFSAMLLLENSALGGSGTRGHGQIKFIEPRVVFRPVNFYQTGSGEYQVDLNGTTDVKKLTEKFDAITWRE